MEPRLQLALAAYAGIAAFVAAYRAKEADIKAYAASTSSKTDDKVVATLGTVVGWLAIGLDLLIAVLPLPGLVNKKR